MQLQHANLPETAQQIADVIGVEKTLELVRAKRESKCQSMYVPTTQRLKSSHWLIQAIGEEAARELSEEYAGFMFTLPKCSSVFKLDRNRKIIQMRQQGMTYRDIADELCMSVSSVKMTYSRWVKSNN